ncbi:endonuclease domain-containing protein [Agrococcus sp. Marseille-P2731]|uniref:endonuclease domain-containing protein n=1 Tax=Agrococcus sp. Marseille-P2731 TaxID=1841862 RepID=UPI000931AA3D|nr:DUF559 domain-containing protein [Agrococcus sp. Marseille-P2731]
METLTQQLGIVSAAQLMAAGATRWQIEVSLKLGELIRVRPGWFATSASDASARAAVAAGGCLSCFSALRLHGVWVPEGKGAHVRLPEHRRRRKVRPDGTRGARLPSCRSFGLEAPITAAADDLEVAFRCALRCGSREEIVVIIDSILQRRLASRAALERWARDAPLAVRTLLDLADGRSESGSESMVRLRLRSLQVATRIQVRVTEGVRVDLLVGERLIIECDSKEHHTAAEAYESDRRRDRRLTARGFVVLRLSYRQIHDEWAEIEQDILAIVRRGGHRVPRRRKISA